MSYTIQTHTHLFSSWAASRAASVTHNRFKVEIGQNILKEANLVQFISNPNSLSSSQTEFNQNHRQWRENIIEIANNYQLSFTHGISAKLINIYFKSAIICGGHHEHENIKYIHPPIDSVLLKKLASINFNGKAKFWRKSNNKRWSKFSAYEYEEVIQEIKNGLKGEPLWTIEQYWQGFQ